MSKCQKKPYDFSLFQGDDHSFAVRYFNPDGTPKDLTGVTARLQARLAYDSAGVVLDLSIGDGLSIPTPLAGRVLVDITNAKSAAIVEGIYVYDLELTFPDGTKKKLIFGKITIRPEVTKV